MLLRRPKLTIPPQSSSYDLLRDALAQYGVQISPEESSRELESLNMDDIDFIEAIELIDRAIDSKIDRKVLVPTTTLSQLSDSIDEARVAR